MTFRFVLRRFYFAIVGLLLLTLPLFALVRADVGHRELPCINTERCPHIPSPLEAGHWWSLFWTGGAAPYDYWPLGLALVAAVAGFEATAIFRARHRVS